jgi:hypothetical protein
MSDFYIPEGCLDFVEASRYVVESIEEDFTSIIESVVGDDDESALTESVVLEAEAKESIKDKIVNAIKGAWEKVKKAFENLLEWLQQQKKELKTKILDKIGGKYAEKIKDLADDAAIGKVHSWQALAKDAEGKISNLSEELKKAENITKGEATKDTLEKRVNELPAVAAGLLGLGGSPKTVGELKELYLEKLQGTEVTITGRAVKAGYRVYMGYVFESSKKEVGKSYNTFKKTFELLKKDVEKWFKADKETKADIVAVAKLHMRAAQLVGTIAGVQMTAFQRRSNEYMRVLTGALRKAKKKGEDKEEKQKTNEAVEADIFNW